MNLSDARFPCEHWKYDRHPLYKAARHPDGRFIDNFIYDHCPGGSPVTAADLEGLGERVDWCTTHQQSNRPNTLGCWIGYDLWEDDKRIDPGCILVYGRLLVPISEGP